jgi:hypothetical protein
VPNQQATVGGVYEFTKTASANLREKEDQYNEAISGFLAGATMGVTSKLGAGSLWSAADTTDTVDSVAARRLPRVFGYGALFSVALTAYYYTGGTLKGAFRSGELDEYERKEMMRKNRRRPIEETLAEIGEGRGEHQFYVKYYEESLQFLLIVLTFFRYPATGVRGAEARETKGEVWD